MSDIQQFADDLFERAGSILGDRLAERRIDPDRHLRVTVIDLDAADVAAIEAVATELGIAGRVRTDRADPRDLDAWERLRHDLLRLQYAQPEVLQSWPTPKPGYRRPPISIDLMANGEAVAADLHTRYGDFVALRVGALRYPLSVSTSSDRWIDDREHVVIEPGEVAIELDGPLSIRSGETAHHAVVLTYPTNEAIPVPMSGRAIADIVDIATGEIVGGYAGPHDAAAVTITTRPPGRSVRVRLLVGTSSFRPVLGFAVPPGIWHRVVPLGRGPQLRVSPPLEFTITA